MFKSTAFILGAGASCGYGYPTGEKLVTRIRDKAFQFLEAINHYKSKVSSRVIVYNHQAVKICPNFISEAAGING
ncbi:MAG: hypothetical protein KGQ41_08730, partial [Alphaproteobacteria bacterium]|nr:hypothetical protein [Alphaproteobacteria bacterium]